MITNNKINEEKKLKCKQNMCTNKQSKCKYTKIQQRKLIKDPIVYHILFVTVTFIIKPFFVVIK